MKRWVCDRMPGHLFREPGHVRCPACREVPEAEHAAVLADEFIASWERHWSGTFGHHAIQVVFADLLERKVIE